MSDNKMSFLPEDYVERRREQRTNVICLIAFGVVLIGVTGMWVAQFQRRADVRRERRDIDSAYADAAKQIEQYEAYQARHGEINRKMQLTQLLVDPLPRSNLLAELANLKPESVSWLDLTLDSKVVAAPKPPPVKSALANKKDEAKKDKEKVEEAPPKPIVSLSVVGVAPSDVQVALYMEKLKQSPFLSDVSLSYTEEVKIADSAMRKFLIEMVLNPAADIRAMEPQPSPARPRDPLALPVDPAASKPAKAKETPRVVSTAAPVTGPATTPAAVPARPGRATSPSSALDRRTKP